MGKVAKGVIWSSIDRFSSQGIGFVLSILIARIVSPSSYGLIVMIQVFLSISQIFIDGGFANALIQKKTRTDVDYSTAFIFNFAVALIIYIILFFCAPYIANFYNKPILSQLTRVIGLNLIIESLCIIQRTKLQIELNFKTQAKVSLIAVVISGTAGVICAYNGMEVWALIVQGLLLQIITTLAFFYFVHWVPKLTFSTESFKQLFGFGSKLMIGNLLTGIYLNIYNLVIGKKYSSNDLAYYNRAFTISQISSVNIENILYKVFYPTLCELQNDRKALITKYYEFLHYSNYIMLPFLSILIALARPLVISILTTKWLPAADLISIFSLNFAFYAWIEQSGGLVNVIGRSGLNLKAQIFKRICSIIILIITIPFGLHVICWGIVAGAIIELSVNVYLDKIALKISILEHIKSQVDVYSLNFITCGVTYIISRQFINSWTQLIIGGICGILCYIALTMLFRLKERSILFRIFSKIH
jgi:teichuronic acid exporter